uniref:Uncharacterized protein n=1 Tax=Macaca nemestrina TaxID=9545 RepID=A0A2K6C407_MACNE|nr:uncharacterized protein LOC105491630 isoform X2 [Macaca nemestrina]
MRVPRHPGGSHRSALGLLCEKGPATASLVQIRCQTVFLRIHPNRSLISPCGSPGPPSRPEPKCLGSWERPAPFFSSLATSSHFRLLTVPKQPTKTLRELGPGPEAENGRKKRSGRFLSTSPACFLDDTCHRSTFLNFLNRPEYSNMPLAHHPTSEN